MFFCHGMVILPALLHPSFMPFQQVVSWWTPDFLSSVPHVEQANWMLDLLEMIQLVSC